MYIIITLEPLIKAPLRKGQPLYKGHFQYPQKCICNTFSTSEKRTVSVQWLVPKVSFTRCSSLIIISFHFFSKWFLKKLGLEG